LQVAYLFKYYALLNLLAMTRDYDLCNFILKQAWLVAREVWEQDAAGSKPVTRTKTPLRPLVSGEFLLFFDIAG